MTKTRPMFRAAVAAMAAVPLTAMALPCDPTAIFAPDVRYATGVVPAGAAISDLDGDGDADLAVTSLADAVVNVFLNNGDGTFAPFVSYGVGSDPVIVSAGDLDGDGDTDLAVTNLMDDSVSVLLNNGDATFAAEVRYGTGAEPFAVAIEDLDGDGDADLAVANTGSFTGGAGSNTVSVLLNNGDGTFATETRFDTGDTPFAVASGDLDGDGDVDLVAANRGGTDVSVLLNNGDGTFATEVRYGVGNEPTWVAIGDLDGDGNADLAVANSADHIVAVLLNSGAGTFTTDAVYGVGGTPLTVEIGDLDGDGSPDLAVVNNGFFAGNGDTVSVLLNDGAGAFSLGADYDVGQSPQFLALGDLDGNGSTDIVTSNSLSEDASVLLNQCAPFVFVADLDCDGSLTVFDFLVFQNLFATGDTSAELDGDGSLTLLDFLAFQNAFDAGCP
ncbi:MAG: FG-GAP-like repeat-containing protein [Phycisphaerales bacterium]